MLSLEMLIIVTNEHRHVEFGINHLKVSSPCKLEWIYANGGIF